MKGYGRTIKVNGEIVEHSFTKGLHYEFIKEQVGGFIESIPYFTDFVDETGNLVKCVAFCNEEGKIKRLPLNSVATLLWYESIKRRSSNAVISDALAGDVLVVWGDARFMRSI